MDPIIRDIIIRFLQHQISYQEMCVLDEWMKDEKHREMFKSFVCKWEKETGCSVCFSPEKAWSNFIFKHRRHSIWKNYMRYAAIILCIVGGGLLWFFVERTGKIVEEQIEIADIKPVGRHAVLTFGEGKKVELREMDTLNLSRLDEVYLSDTLKKDILADKCENSSLYHSLWVPAGAEFQLTLEDGTKVWLNNLTTLRYPVKFAKDKRLIYLEGEAYFEVSRDEHLPFYIITPNAELCVLGTSFNVNARKEQEAVTLVSGSLAVAAGTQQIILQPGNQAIVKEKSVVSVKDVDTFMYTAWLKGLFYFSNETLENVMKRLSEWYRFNYRFEEESLKKEKIMCIVNKYDEFEEIMQLIEDSQIVRIEYDQEGLVIKPFVQ